MGPKAVMRHIQSTRHKKIVNALATNPEDVTALRNRNMLLPSDASFASAGPNSPVDPNFANSLGLITGKTPGELDADALSQILSAPHFPQLTLEDISQSNSSKNLFDTSNDGLFFVSYLLVVNFVWVNRFELEPLVVV